MGLHKLYIYVVEPIKYSWKFAPIQVLIQIRTWGKATHSGFILDNEGIEAAKKLLSTSPLTHEELLKILGYDVKSVSATFPKVRYENLFETYKNDRIYVKSVLINDIQYNKFNTIINSSIGKKGYSILGLAWFALAPFLDWIVKTKDVDPKRSFCSEFVTNVLWSIGVKVFSFEGTIMEDIKVMARKMTEEQFVSVMPIYYGDIYPDIDWKKLWKEANTDVRYYGYKISPKMLKLNSFLSTYCVFEPKKIKGEIVWHLK